MTNATVRPRAAIYLRISSDPEGRRHGVTRQETDCRELCTEYGYDVVGLYCDNDVSASGHGRERERPEFERMITSARAGQIDLIVAYSTSRLTRQPIEWEQLIRLHNRQGTRFHLYKRGLLDLTKAVVLRDLRNDATSDAYYADEVRELVRRASKARAEEGKWHGGQVPYGFVRVGPKGEQGKLEHHPERADLVRESARRILNGESLYSVCMSLNERKLLTAPTKRSPEGARWGARTLKRILTSPNTVGIRFYNGQEYDGQWPGILDRKTWDRLVALLNDDDRATRQSWLPAHKYLLSGLLVCGLCGTKLTSNTVKQDPTDPDNEAKRRVSFLCSPATKGCGKIRINREMVETFVVRQVLAVLNVPAVRESLTTRDESAEDDELRQAIREDERRLRRLEDDFYDDVIDRPTYNRQRDRITERAEANRRRLSATQRATFVLDTGGRSLDDAWREHTDDVAWRRTLMQHMVDRIVVNPHPSDMPSTITAKRGETTDELAKRRAEHAANVMARRAFIEWKAEALPDGIPVIDDEALAALTPDERAALWLTRMHANQPVQVTSAQRVDEVTTLMR